MKRYQPLGVDCGDIAYAWNALRGRRLVCVFNCGDHFVTGACCKEHLGGAGGKADDTFGWCREHELGARVVRDGDCGGGNRREREKDEQKAK